MTKRLPHQTKIQLLCLLALGGLLGLFAASSGSVPVQLSFVGVAVLAGAYAGLLVRRGRAKRQ